MGKRCKQLVPQLGYMGSIVSLCIVVAFFLSLVRAYGYRWTKAALYINYGQVCIAVIRDRNLGDMPTPHGKLWQPSGEMAGMWSLPRWDARGMVVLWIPLWFPFLIIVIPSLAVMCLGRRKRVFGCEECSYDLTGNVSGVCPECGTKI